MKKLALFLITLLPFSAHAETVLNDTICSASGVCINPAPGVEWVSFSPVYDRVTASINGVLYDSGIYTVPIDVSPMFSVRATLYGPGNSLANIFIVVKHWTTHTSNGRGQMYVQHYELISGTIQ